MIDINKTRETTGLMLYSFTFVYFHITQEHLEKGKQLLLKGKTTAKIHHFLNKRLFSKVLAEFFLQYT